MKKNTQKYAELKKAIGNAIHDARRRKQLTQQQVIERGFCTKKPLQEMESGYGTFRLDALLDICIGLEIDFHHIAQLVEQYTQTDTDVTDK